MHCTCCTNSQLIDYVMYVLQKYLILTECLTLKVKWKKVKCHHFLFNCFGPQPFTISAVGQILVSTKCYNYLCHLKMHVCTLDISKIFCWLWYFTTVHKSMHIPLVSSKVTQKMDWKHGYLARSWYILVLAVLGRAGGWKLMQPC